MPPPQRQEQKLIPGFSAEESRVLREAHKTGVLTTRQQQEIVRRSKAFGERPQVRQPEPLEAATSGLLNEGLFVGLGAITGTGLTLPTAPATGGLSVVAGGVLGAAAGSVVFDNLQNMLISMGVIEGRQFGAGEVVERATKEAALDLAFVGVGTLVRPILGARALLAKMSGVTKDEVGRLVRLADDLGIGLGAVDVGGGLPKTFAKAVGVFPITGSPGRVAATVKQAQSVAATNRILDDLAPNATTMGGLSIDMVKAAKNVRQEFRRVSGNLYDNFRGLVENAKVKEIIPTTNARKVAGELATEAREGRLILATGEEFEAPVAEKATKYLSQFEEFPENITIQQYRARVQELQELMSLGRIQGADVRKLAIMKDALEVDLNNIRVDLLPSGEGDAIRRSLNVANEFYSKGIVAFQTPAGKVALKTTLPPGFRGMESFETPTAKQFGRVEKNIFGPGRDIPGTLNEDEVARVAVNLRSAQAITDLEALVGRKTVRDAARFHVEQARNQSIEEIIVGTETVEILNPIKFLKLLGLKSRDKGQIEALDALLKRGGIKISDLEELAEVIGRIEGIGDPATFVKRRVILAGVTGGVAALGFGAVAAGKGGLTLLTMIPVTVLTLLARKGSKIFATRQNLRNMITALDTAKAEVPRRAALTRLIEAVGRQEIEAKEVRGAPKRVLTEQRVQSGL